MNKSIGLRLFCLFFVFSLLLNSYKVQAKFPNLGKTADINIVPSRIITPGPNLIPTNQNLSQGILDLAGDRWDLLQELTPAYTDAVTVTVGAWRNMRPTDSYLRGISMLPNNFSVDCKSKDQKSQGWIVGDAHADTGAILGYCNGVWDHSITVESIPTDLRDVQALSPTLAVAVGVQGTILIYQYDSVAQDWVWVKYPIPVGNQDLVGVSLVPDGSGGYTGWAVGWSAPNNPNGKGALIRGTITPIPGSNPQRYIYNWQNVTNNFANLPLVDFYFGVQVLSPTNAWATGGKVGQYGVLLHWDGSTWSKYQQIGSTSLQGLKLLSPSDGWAVSRDGQIYHYNGSQWNSVPSPTTEYLENVEFEQNGTGWIAGHNGTILKYQAGQWIKYKDLRSDPWDFRAIDFTNGHGWMIGFNDSQLIGGQILEFENGIWLPVTTPTDNRLNDLYIVSENDAWAVGDADPLGCPGAGTGTTCSGTIIHWDGEHWQRWYQPSLPIPRANLYTIDMISATLGWAAGDPLTPGGPAVFLKWDGYRWYEPRYLAPVNVRVTDLDLLDNLDGFGGWAVAETGQAIAKWDGVSEYWTANHTCGGNKYNLRSVSVVSAPTQAWGNWDAWAVGSWLFYPNTIEQYVIKFMPGCAGSNAWDAYVTYVNTPILNDIYMLSGSQTGYAVGEENSWAVIYRFNNGSWQKSVFSPPNPSSLTSRFHSVDVVEDSGIVWTAGHGPYNGPFFYYIDGAGGHPNTLIFPTQGSNINHRPVNAIRMVSDTMGWAVGDASSNLSVLYQYPFPNFILDSIPTSRAVRPGESTFYSIRVNSIGGFSADVSLKALSLPFGISANITPTTINASNPATLTLTIDPATPLGVYDIKIEGSSTFRSGDTELSVSRSLIIKLMVTDHPLYSVVPSHAPAGSQVSFLGAGFGPDPGAGNRSTPTNHIILAGQQMPDVNVLSWSDNQIVVLVPDDVSLFPQGPIIGEASVTVNGTSSNQDLSYQLENYLSSVSTWDNGFGMSVELQGTSFGMDPGSIFRSTQYEHVGLDDLWVPNNDVLTWSNNSITFITPYTTLGRLLRVTSNGYSSNSMVMTYQLRLPFVRR